VPGPTIPRSEVALVAGAAFLVFTRVVGFSLVLPGFRDHGATLTGDATLIGTALSAYGLTFALAQLPLGMLSDRIGRRPVLLLGSLFFVAGSAWAAVAGSIEELIAARLVQGLGAIGATAMAAVGETVPESRRTSAMAVVGIPAGVGFLVGLIAGTLLLDALGIPGLFWVTAALGVLAAIPVLGIRFLPPERRGQAVSLRGSLSPAVLSLAAAGFATNYALTTVVFFLPDSRPMVLAATLVMAFVLMAVASQKIDKARLVAFPIALSLAVVAVAAPAYSLAPSSRFLLLGGVAFFTAHAVLSASLPSQVSRLSGRAGGRGHGIQTIVAYLGTFVAGPVAGHFAAEPRLAFILLGALAVACALLVLGLLKRNGSPSFLSTPS
jgi:MFS family permease